MGHKFGKPRKCSLCDQLSVARGLCRNHYAQKHRAGKLDAFPKISPVEAFVNRIRKTNSCWLWQGTKNDYGYGIFLLPGEVPVRAHRFAYELWKGPIPDGFVVMHSCDNPPCVNPAHLSIGTKLDNNRDASLKGRTPTGTRHWNGRLTDEQIADIRTDPRTHVAIALDYGVSQSHVTRIKGGKARKHAL